MCIRDSYYIVLYGTTGILAGMFTMLVDYGVNLESRRQQLLTCLQAVSYTHLDVYKRQHDETKAAMGLHEALEKGRHGSAKELEASVSGAQEHLGRLMFFPCLLYTSRCV